MLENGILGKDLGFDVRNAKKPGELITAIDELLEKYADSPIVDITFVTRGEENLVVFFFKLPVSR